MAQPISLKYQPREAFKRFHARTQRWGMLVVHRRGGKTVAAINELISRALHSRKPNFQGVYVAPFRGQAKDIAWKYLKEYGDPVIAKASESELHVTLINGARIFLKGADNPDSLRGLYFDAVILDETADIKANVWEAIIRPALMDRRGWAVFIGTPKGKSNLFYQLLQEAKKHPDRWFFLELKASESGLLPADDLAETKESSDPDTYEQEYECSFEAALKGSYHGKAVAAIEQAGQVTTVDHDSSYPVHVAFDLGWTDSTAAWFFQCIADQIRVIDYFEAAGLEPEDIDNALRERPYRYGTMYLPHDAKAKRLGMNKSFIEQVLTLGWKPKIVADLGVQDGIQAARLTLRRCWFDKTRCAVGLECLRNYSRKWNPENKTFSEQPKHDRFSHGADAFRYLSLSFRDDLPPNDPIPVKPVEPKQLTLYATPLTLDLLWSHQPTGRQRSRI